MPFMTYTLAASQTYPAPFRPGESRLTSGAKLLHRHTDSGSTSPQPGNEMNFPKVHRGD